MSLSNLQNRLDWELLFCPSDISNFIQRLAGQKIILFFKIKGNLRFEGEIPQCRYQMSSLTLWVHSPFALACNWRLGKYQPCWTYKYNVSVRRHFDHNALLWSDVTGWWSLHHPHLIFFSPQFLSHYMPSPLSGDTSQRWKAVSWEKMWQIHKKIRQILLYMEFHKYNHSNIRHTHFII